MNIFKSKKRGLRSFRNAIVLFIIILIVPLIILFFARVFFSAPPIYPKYEELVKRAKSSENGYIFFKGAKNLAKMMHCGYFSSTTWKIMLSDKPEGFHFDEDVFRLERWDEFTYFNYYKFLVKRNLFGEEMEAYFNKRYSITGPTNFHERSCIYPGENWVQDFLRNSQGILDNIKKARQKDFFLPYENISGYIRPEMIMDYSLLLIELVNVVLLIQKGDYPSALDWIDSFNQIALLMEPLFLWGPSLVAQQLSVISIVASYPPLTEPFYEDLLCLLTEFKEKIKSIDFNTVYQNALFYFEDSFVQRQNQLMYSPPYYSIPNSISMFFAYNEISRMLDKHREVFTTATWKDIEDAILYNKGKVYSSMVSIKTIKKRSSVGSNEYWMFWSGEKFKNLLLRYNSALCSIYGTILIVLLEQYYKQNGVYPDDRDNFMKDYFTEEEIIWMNDYLDISLSPEKYFIDYYPIPKRERDTHKSDIFQYRKTYRLYAY